MRTSTSITTFPRVKLRFPALMMPRNADWLMFVFTKFNSNPKLLFTKLSESRRPHPAPTTNAPCVLPTDNHHHHHQAQALWFQIDLVSMNWLAAQKVQPLRPRLPNAVLLSSLLLVLLINPDKKPCQIQIDLHCQALVLSLLYSCT